MFWRLDLLWKEHSPEHFPKLHLELKSMETLLFFSFSVLILADLNFCSLLELTKH